MTARISIRPERRHTNVEEDEGIFSLPLSSKENTPTDSDTQTPLPAAGAQRTLHQVHQCVSSTRMNQRHQKTQTLRFFLSVREAALLPFPPLKSLFKIYPTKCGETVECPHNQSCWTLGLGVTSPHTILKACKALRQIEPNDNEEVNRTFGSGHVFSSLLTNFLAH